MESHPVPTRAAVATWVTLQIASYLQLAPDVIRTDVPVAEYGMDSVLALGLCGDIEDEFELVVDPTSAWDYPTIDLLSAFIHDQLATPELT